MQPPATAGQVEALRARVRAELGAPLPAGYEEFLLRYNGLDSNGLRVYATETVPLAGRPDRTLEGFVEANRAWRADEYYERLLVFAESAQRLYVYDLDEKRYQVLDRATCGVLHSFAAFQGLLRAALSSHRPHE